MLMPVEVSKLKTVYIVVLFFTGWKSIGVLVPDVASVTGLTSYKSRDDGCNTADNYTGNNITARVTATKLKWIDSLLLLEALVWELFPIYFVSIKKKPVEMYHIRVWAICHCLLSFLYGINKMTRLNGVFDIICTREIALQLISASLAIAMYWWAKKMVHRRLFGEDDENSVASGGLQSPIYFECGNDE